jgi:hypothetical protein
MRPDRLGVFDICQKRTVGQSSARLHLTRSRLELEMTDEQFHVGFPYNIMEKQL